jgi:hypothetical protein
MFFRLHPRWQVDVCQDALTAELEAAAAEAATARRRHEEHLAAEVEAAASGAAAAAAERIADLQSALSAAREVRALCSYLERLRW